MQPNDGGSPDLSSPNRRRQRRRNKYSGVPTVSVCDPEEEMLLSGSPTLANGDSHSTASGGDAHASDRSPGRGQHRGVRGRGVTIHPARRRVQSDNSSGQKRVVCVGLGIRGQSSSCCDSPRHRHRAGLDVARTGRLIWRRASFLHPRAVVSSHHHPDAVSDQNQPSSRPGSAVRARRPAKLSPRSPPTPSGAAETSRLERGLRRRYEMLVHADRTEDGHAVLVPPQPHPRGRERRRRNVGVVLD
ncbi:unnamed protein product, partial [Ectocarpus sp. 13 AM-2016]